ncbi:MAG: sigma-70 family RNA polymerase sigma factor, partial [Pyrinomonadaceae bacterium]
MEPLSLMTEKGTNRDLLAACKTGDREAMHALYTGNQRRVFSVALNYFGGNQELAEDITQKVFLKLLTKFDFRGDSEFSTWLYRVTLNACTDEERKMNRFVDITGIFDLIAYRGSNVQQLMVECEEVSAAVQNEIVKLRPK